MRLKSDAKFENPDLVVSKIHEESGELSLLEHPKF